MSVDQVKALLAKYDSLLEDYKRLEQRVAVLEGKQSKDPGLEARQARLRSNREGRDPSKRTPPEQAKAVIQKWLAENTHKTKWLVVGHGHEHRDALNYLPPSLQRDAALFLVDINANVRPDVTLDMMQDMHLFPENAFDGVLFAYWCFRQGLVHKEFERVVKQGGYWVSAAAYRDSQLQGPLQQLHSFSIARQMGPFSDHFVVPYKFQYTVPREYWELFDVFVEKGRYILRELFHRCGTDLQARKEANRAFRAHEPKLFKEMFNMTPVELGCLELNSKDLRLPE